MGRNKTKKIRKNITITGIADKGQAIGRDEEGMVYFVKGAVPGDVVDVWVRKKKSRFKTGEVDTFVSYSDLRVQPFCEHFGNCGGCKWQDLSYDSQLKYKEQAVVDALERLGRLEIKEKLPILGCDDTRFYRNKMEYSFSDRRWVPQEELDREGEVDFGPATGFHRAGAFNKIVQIDKCHLQEDLSNQIRNKVHAFAMDKEWTFYNAKGHTGFMRNMLVRNTTLGEWMVAVIFGEDVPEQRQEMMDMLATEFPDLTALYYVINTKMNDSLADQKFILHKGQPKIQENLGHITYQIGPQSFFQTNTHQAKKLYDRVVELAELQGTEVVYDLYTGLGSIALYIADKCEKVIGIEEVSPAIDDANQNKRLNNITNATFVVGDCKEVFNEAFISEYGSPDVIIVDPPRVGLHKDVVAMLAKSQVEKIVYVSCNPATQARDISLLSEEYTVELIQPVDMFPHTHHIENIAILKKI